MKLLVFALVGLATASVAANEDKLAAPEEALASLRLGTSLPPALRCSKATFSDSGAIHRFHVGAGPGGHEAYLLVSTVCPKAQCASQAELTIREVAVRTTPYPGPTCALESPLVLATAKGLRLGDSISRVRTLYGKPHRSVSKHGPATSYEYAGRTEGPGLEGPREAPNMGFEVGFDAGHVVEMSLFVDTDQE